MTAFIKGPSRLLWRRAFSFSVGIFALGVVALRLSAQQKSETSTAASSGAGVGKAVWAGNCAGCHGLDGRGGERGPNIATNPEIASLTDAQISHIVHDGSPNMAMPALGRTLNAAQIAAVVKHLRTLQGGQKAEALPGDPKKGGDLFYGKAECSSCHMAAGLGGFLGQDLTDAARSRSADEIREAIVHPAKEPDPRAKTAVVIVRSGERYSGIIRNEDNFSVQLQTTDGVFHLFDRAEIERVEYQPQSLMPTDYGTRLTPAELNDLTSFLMATSRAHQPANRAGEHKAWEDKDED
jgi:putative heme-binding domain-containing protein